MSARSDIVGVLMRTPEPRTVVQLGWHLPHLTHADIQGELEEMKVDGQVTRGVSPAGTLAYVLVPEARMAAWHDDGGLPGPAMAAALLVGLVTLACLALLVGVYAAKFSLAIVRAAFGL